MALLLPIVLATLVSCAVTVAAEDLASCGISRYYPSQYTCFDDNFLCPIVNGDRFIRCGDACYTTALYSCSNTTLAPLSHSGQQPLEDCGSSKFNPFDYVCLDGDFLCPINGVEATLRCGATCYEPFLYSCAAGVLSPVPPPPCVPDFGASELCNDQGCFQLECCPGLISIADKCRDPCDFDPSFCPQSAS